jgi:thioredoxin-like negative regulator of GroEL
VLDQIAAERTDELKVVRVDIDEQPELAAYFGVSSIPTIVLFKRGMPVAGAVGARSKPQLESALGLRQITDGNHSAEARGLRRLIARLSVRRA